MGDPPPGGRRGSLPILPWALLVLVPLASGCLSDLRPRELRRAGAPSESEANRALERLRAAAVLQGLGTWSKTAGTHLELRDAWNSGMKAWFAVPWKSGELFRYEYVRGKQAGILTRFEGDEVGCEHLRYGDGSTAYVDGEGRLKPVFGDEVSDFFIPAIRYLHDLPFRILEATVFAPAGTGQFQGRVFDRVFATWKSAAPSTDHDQYVVWIARDTGFVEIIEYTSRDESRFSRYFTLFDDFQTVDGVVSPRRMTILEALTEDCLRNYLHQFRVESLAHGPVILRSPGSAPNPAGSGGTYSQPG